MNNYDIIDEYGYVYPKVLPKVIDKALEVEKVSNAVFTIIFVSEEKIREINKEYRGKDSVTDVISFAFEDSGKLPINDIRILGDIFICIPRMLEQAKEYSSSNVREICFLAVHGLLHLLGYDHMESKDEEIMIAKQELILNEFTETRWERTK